MKPIKLYKDLSIPLYVGEARVKRVAPIPPPITYLTNWKIVGNSELHGNEIWSCGEYSAVDNKYHILVQPLGGSIADIALTEPLRKVNDVADTIEFPTETEGKALVIRNLKNINLGSVTYSRGSTAVTGKYRWLIDTGAKVNTMNILNCKYTVVSASVTYDATSDGVASDSSGNVRIYDSEYDGSDDANNIKAANTGYELLYELATPITELVDAPQIQEAESYSCVISQGGKAVSWSSFSTESNSD